MTFNLVHMAFRRIPQSRRRFKLVVVIMACIESIRSDKGSSRRTSGGQYIGSMQLRMTTYLSAKLRHNPLIAGAGRKRQCGYDSFLPVRTTKRVKTLKRWIAKRVAAVLKSLPRPLNLTDISKLTPHALFLMCIYSRPQLIGS